MDNLNFSQEEFNLLSNADLLKRKRIIQEKIFALLESTQEAIKKIDHRLLEQHFPAGKISRGENYRSLPYLILDFPAKFTYANSFACRTMFLWGNFFSLTCHLQGVYLKNNETQLLAILENLNNEGIFISQGDTPWEYHYNPDNYLPIRSGSIEKAFKRDFIKVSKRISLEDYSIVPEYAHEFYRPFLTKLKLYE
jgi:hypothetical protein